MDWKANTPAKIERKLELVDDDCWVFNSVKTQAERKAVGRDKVGGVEMRAKVF